MKKRYGWEGLGFGGTPLGIFDGDFIFNEEAPDKNESDHHHCKANLGVADVGVKIDHHSFSRNSTLDNNPSMLKDMRRENIAPSSDPVNTQESRAPKTERIQPAARSVKSEESTLRWNGWSVIANCIKFNDNINLPSNTVNLVAEVFDPALHFHHCQGRSDDRGGKV